MEAEQSPTESLSKETQRPSRLRYDGTVMELSEIAARLHLTIDQTQAAQERGLQKLRSLLESMGVTRTMVLAAFENGQQRVVGHRHYEPEDSESDHADATLRLVWAVFSAGPRRQRPVDEEES